MIRVRLGTSDGKEFIGVVNEQDVGKAIAKYHLDGKLEVSSVMAPVGGAGDMEVCRTYFHPHLVFIEPYRP